MINYFELVLQESRGNKMHRYVIKRLLFLIPTVLGVTLIIFTVMNITPGDPGRMMLGPTALQADVDAVNHELGYDQPILERYVNYIKGIITEGDFGTSYATRRPVLEELMPRFFVTLRMAIFVLLISVGIGVPVGIYSAVKQYTLWDTVPTMIAFFIAAIPSFVVGMILLFVFALKLHIFPSVGLKTLDAYILPITAASICELSSYLRFTKSSMLEAIRQDYIRTARGKGVSERMIIWKHALKNALLPVITSIGMRFGMLLAGMVTTEQLFSIAGVGSLIVDSISKKDEPMVIACAIMVSVCFTLLMLLVDIAYAYIDPRIKAKYSKLKG